MRQRITLSPSPFRRELGALRAYSGGSSTAPHLEQHLGSVITHVARPRPSARPQSLRAHWSCKRAERVREGRVVGADGDKYKPLDRHAFTTLEVPKGPERGFLTAHSGA